MTMPTRIDRPIGITQDRIINGWPTDQSEANPTLMWPLSVRVYDEMRRTESQIQAVLRSIGLPILAASWRLDPNGARPEVVEQIAADLGMRVLGSKDEEHARLRTRGRFDWNAHLRQALLVLPYGHMGFEIVCRVEDGKARLAALAPRMPTSIAEINVTADGELESIRQTYASTDRGKPRPIPADRLCWYTNEQEGGNLAGVSLLRSAYRDYLLKNKTLRDHVDMLERNGMGVPVIEAPEMANQAILDQCEDIATRYRAGIESGLALPHGARLTLRGVEGSLPDALPTIRYFDESIAQSVLAMFLKLGTTQTGSRALGQTMTEFFGHELEAVAKGLAHTATAQVVERLVDWNYGEAEPAPRIVVSFAKSTEDLTAEALKQLLDSGAITADPTLEVYLRDFYRLPGRDDSPPPVRPVVAAARPRSPRQRRVRAAAGDDRPALPLTDLPEPFRTLYADRAALVQQQLDDLQPALTALAQAVDLEPAATLALAVRASISPEEQALAQLIEDGMRAALGEVDDLAEQAVTGMRAAWATGQAEGATLLAVGDTAIDYAMVFDEAIDAAADLDSLLANADDWLAQHIGAASRSAAQAVTDALTDTTVTRSAVIGAMVDDLGSRTNAEVLYDYALSASLSEGARARYESEGLTTADFLTAADERVDGVCLDAAAGNAHPLVDAPVPPLHINCRCCLAPATDAIRDLLT